MNEELNKGIDNIVCPNCGSHNVRWIPYPKNGILTWFVLWVVFSFGGWMISPVIFLVGGIALAIAIIVRIRQSFRASTYNRMFCPKCGTEFDVPKADFKKGER